MTLRNKEIGSLRTQVHETEKHYTNLMAEAKRQWQQESHRELKSKLEQMQVQVNQVRKAAGHEVASTAAQYAAAIEQSDQKRQEAQDQMNKEHDQQRSQLAAQMSLGEQERARLAAANLELEHQVSNTMRLLLDYNLVCVDGCYEVGAPSCHYEGAAAGG